MPTPPPQTLLGVDGAGKSTLFAWLRDEPQAHITPTWGFNTEAVQFGHQKLTMYDLGGGKRIRDIWQRYFAEVRRRAWA